jgi:uncharacterized membrane protein
MRLSFSFALLGIVLVGAGCSEGSAPEPVSALSADPVAELGGLDLAEPYRILGTEPFWAVEVTASSMIWTSPDQPTQTALNPGPAVQGTIAIYRTETDTGQDLVVTLVATECTDGMSDRLYPLTARVEIGGQSLNGCAASKVFLETGPQP